MKKTLSKVLQYWPTAYPRTSPSCSRPATFPSSPNSRRPGLLVCLPKRLVLLYPYPSHPPPRPGSCGHFSLEYSFPAGLLPVALPQENLPDVTHCLCRGFPLLPPFLGLTPAPCSKCPQHTPHMKPTQRH